MADPSRQSPFSLHLQDAFPNGSIWQNVSTDLEGSFYPFASLDPGVNITTFPNLSARLDFMDPGYNAWISMLVITELLAPNLNRGMVQCAYPLSGQYDRLPRFLFYLAAVVAVIGRHLSWVAEAALGLIMTYSSATAIHLFALLATYKYGMPISRKNGILSWVPDLDSAEHHGDIDFWGIAPVISLSVIILIPMLSWSKTFRSHSAKGVVQCWALLMLAAFIPFLIFIRGYGVHWTPDVVASMAMCRNGTRDDCQAPLLEGSPPLYQSREQYDRCQCVDFCGTIAPTSPMRTGTGMVPVLVYSSIEGLASNARVASFNKALFVLWIFTLAQGFLALLSSNTSQESVRNRLFKILYGDSHGLIGFLLKGRRRNHILEKYRIKAPDKTSRYWKTRCVAAKSIATVYYIVAVFGMVLYPVLFILTILFLELLLATIPSSERSSAVGAWSPWVIASLAVVSVAIPELHSYLKRKVNTAKQWIQYDADERSAYGTKGDDTLRKTKWPDYIRHAVFKIRYFFSPSQRRWKELRAWWQDPERRSYPEKLPHDEVAFAPPECKCANCVHQRQETPSRSGQTKGTDGDSKTRLAENEHQLQTDV